MIATSIIVRAETRVAKRKEWVPPTDLEIQAQDWPFQKDKAAAVHFQKYNILSRPQVSPQLNYPSNKCHFQSFDNLWLAFLCE